VVILFCAVKSSTESLSDSPLTSNKDQCENPTITISTVELKNLIKAILDEQIMPLTAHISELQILIQKLSAENSLLRSEFSKLNSNFQVLKANEVKTVDEIIRNDQQVKISYAECVSKNSQKKT
jgi:regulator of replication initiation timing